MKRGTYGPPLCIDAGRGALPAGIETQGFVDVVEQSFLYPFAMRQGNKREGAGSPRCVEVHARARAVHVEEDGPQRILQNVDGCRLQRGSGSRTQTSRARQRFIGESASKPGEGLPQNCGDGHSATIGHGGAKQREIVDDIIHGKGSHTSFDFAGILEGVNDDALVVCQKDVRLASEEKHLQHESGVKRHGDDPVGRVHENSPNRCAKRGLQEIDRVPSGAGNLRMKIHNRSIRPAGDNEMPRIFLKGDGQLILSLRENIPDLPSFGRGIKRGSDEAQCVVIG